jgi:bifunctional UDP-N-acetylglucosamine pyrophosphorylase/glucosamine-1-phosphate N-acetyltransferase
MPDTDSELHIVILAAGLGRRMKSVRPKVLHRVNGQSLLARVLETASALNPASITVVVGHGGDDVRASVAARDNLQFVRQEQQLGTAHALAQTEPVLATRSGTVVLLSGDVPLLTVATLQHLVAVHRSSGAAATVVTALVQQPYGYGRVVRLHDRVAKIVEERDASPEERRIHEINGGIYAFALEPLFDALRAVGADNTQGEHYLTDLVAIYRRRNLAVEAVQVVPDEVRGVNSRTELAEVGAVMRQKKNEELMASGVTIVDPATTYIDDDVVIGPDTVIHPGAVLEAGTRVGSACEIHSWVRVHRSEVGDRVTIHNCSVVSGARIDSGASIGPFAHIRPDTTVGEGAKVGNFVELKNTTLGPASKASHLTYLGDTVVGSRVNVGAGTITCNYDGEQKHQTVIEDGAFIGSDSQLIAPVRVGKDAYVGAGSSIAEDVPPGALGIARSRQQNIEGWVKRRKSS